MQRTFTVIHREKLDDIEREMKTKCGKEDIIKLIEEFIKTDRND